MDLVLLSNASQVVLVVKNPPANAGDERDAGSIPRLGRSPGGGKPLQCSCLENPMDREAWWATVHGVSKSQTRLSDNAQHNTLVKCWSVFMFICELSILFCWFAWTTLFWLLWACSNLKPGNVGSLFFFLRLLCLFRASCNSIWNLRLAFPVLQKGMLEFC